MKQFFLSGILTLSAAASFAQNSATVTQTGTSQTATASQTGFGLSATLSQVGTVANNQFNTAISSQTGVGHNGYC